ncbi:MAG: hypothetical protein REI94_03570 [Moraxellaceae bacterium]|nr:hypothetical protein [Moraxellaceae bacterium]
MPEIITAWECIGCGRLERPQNCVGVCQDRKVNLVAEHDYVQLAAELAQARQQLESLRNVMRQIVKTTPRNAEWERSYRALQARAQQALGKESPEVAAEPVAETAA